MWAAPLESTLSNMKKTSRLAGAAVKQVEQYVEIHRELTDIEKLMAIPPELGKPFAADGISFTDALEHPLLGPALIDFHDCLVWPTDDERDHCEGVGTFLLVLRFAEAGHPLRAMPLPGDLSEQIRVRAMNDRAPEIAAIMKARKRGRLREQVPGMLIAKTIHGTDTLISNVDSSVRLVLSFWGKYAPKDERKENPTATSRGPGIADFEEYAEAAVMALSDRADHFDRGQGARFTTFVYKRLWGVMMDWFDQYLSEKLRRVDIETVRDAIADGGGLTFDETVERIGPGEKLKIAADAARLNARDRMILNERAKGKKLVQIAQEQGIDPAHIYVLASRMAKKLRKVC